MILYARLAIYALVSICASFLLTTFRVSIWILDGLHTYIHPESIENRDQGGPRALIKRPGMYNGSADGDEDLSQAKGKAKGNKSKKDKGIDSHFNDANAQIFRLRLGDSHIQTREYFKEYDEALIYAALALSNLLVYKLLPECSTKEAKAITMFFSGDLVPFFVGFYAVYKLARILFRISLERSASRNSEKLLSVLVGVVGFVASLLVLYVFTPSSVDLRIGIEKRQHYQKDGQNSPLLGYMKFFLAMFSGWLAALLFIPAHKSVRSFWLGTDQLMWNLSVLGSGKIVRTLMYLNVVMPVFTSLLWIKPMANTFILQSWEHQKSHNVIRGSTLFQSDMNGKDGENNECFHYKRDMDYNSELQPDVSECLSSNSGLRFTESCVGKEERLAQDSCSDGQYPVSSSVSDRTNDRDGRIKCYSWGSFDISCQENWSQNIGMHYEDFKRFRVWCLLFTAVLQLLLMRTNLQMYLNEAVLSWYQRLHSSKVPNLDFSRAKLFLHNHFICLVVLQFFIPGALTLLLLGLSQMKDSSFSGMSVLGSISSSSRIIEETSVYLAWWIQLVWAILTCSILALYRPGLQIL